MAGGGGSNIPGTLPGTGDLLGIPEMFRLRPKEKRKRNVVNKEIKTYLDNRPGEQDPNEVRMLRRPNNDRQ